MAEFFFFLSGGRELGLAPALLLYNSILMMIAGITRKTHGWRFSFGHFKKKTQGEEEEEEEVAAPLVNIFSYFNSVGRNKARERRVHFFSQCRRRASRVLYNFNEAL